MHWEFVVMPLIGASIGWLTNRLAIWMLFHPREPIRVLRFEFQGLLPRRRGEFAEGLAEVVEAHLLSADELFDSVDTPAFRRRVLDAVVAVVDERIRDYLPNFLPAGVRDAFRKVLRDGTERQAEEMVEKGMQRIRESLRDELRVGELVQERVEAFDVAQLEGLFRVVAGREFRAIEWFGGAIGFLVGLGQALLVYGVDSFGVIP